MQVSTPPHRASRRILHAAGALVVIACAIACARFLLGRMPLDTHDVRWLWGDLAQVRIAWSQFIDDPDAHWLTSTRLSYPLPLSISLFDPMPLLLLLARPFASWIPEGTQYFGYYFLACMALQGWFGYLATRKAVSLAGGSDDLPSTWIAVCAGVMFATLPYTFYRFQGHTALSSQWVLVLSIWVALASLDWRRFRWCVANASIVFIATGLNPYLALMVLISDGILTLTSWRRLQAKEIVVRLLVLALVAGIGLWIFGFTSGAAADSGGYGQFSMNLLGPIDSHHMARLFPLDVRAVMEHQHFEGFTYLGFGVILLCLAGFLAAVVSKRSPSRFPFVGSLLIVLAGTLLAVSATVSLGTHFVEIPLPKSVLFLLSRFRGSGRLFWIAGFWLLLASVAACVRGFGVRRTAVIVTVLALVQLVDVRPIATQVRKNLASGSALRLDGIPPGRFSAVLVYPAWQCDTEHAPGGGVRNYEAVGELAASRDMPTNNFYAARTPDAQRAYHCDYASRLASIDPHALYLLSANLFEEHRGQMENGHACSALDANHEDIKCVPKDLP